MHIQHKAGDKMYVDYAGKKLNLVDKETGEVKQVEFFVAILGSSQHTYAEATMSQGKQDFITSVENALHFYGGVPAAIVPDNLKSAVTKSNRYEPTLNETFYNFSEKPFDITPRPQFLYSTPGHSEALASLIYGIRERREHDPPRSAAGWQPPAR